MTDRPPTRYDEEGKSLPERGSGVPSSQLDAAPGEPEKLVIPAGAVNWLLMKAFQTPEGDAWMRGFITAHGEPSWVVGNQWGLRSEDAAVVRTPPQHPQIPQQPQPQRNGRP